jgi:SPP1 family predicted phage head-tail adaptor
MRIGKLNKRVTIKTVTRTADGLGGYTETISTVKETWAGIRPLSAKETLSYGLELGDRTAEIRLRFDGTVNQTNYIEFGSRVYRIKSVVNPDEGNREYVLICTERTD